MWYQVTKFPSVEGCVYRLWYAEKYVVIKCKTIIRSVENINNDLKHFFQETPKGRKKDNLYYKFYSHVAANPFQSFSIEIVLASNNPLELLKSEHTALQLGKTDEKCLNSTFEVYIPQFTQVNGKKSWINRGYYLNFMHWKADFIKKS